MSLADKKIQGAPMGNEARIINVIYDFDEDGGTQADLDVLQSDGAMICELQHIYTETAMTSGGAALIDLGKGDGGTEFLSDKGFGDFSANAIIKPDAEAGIYLADGEKIVMGIEGADLTAGKIHFRFKCYKAGA